MLNTQVVSPVCISPDDRREMFSLMDLYYENMNQDKFTQDIVEKDWVVLFKDADTTVGFSTLREWSVTCEGVAVKGLFSGDTIIHGKYWGKMQLQAALCRLIWEVYTNTPDRLVYWVLSSKGYQTYGLLSLYFQEFFPRYDRQTPPFEQSLINLYGSLKYVNCFDAKTGVAYNDSGSDYLRPGVADITKSKLRNPNYRFFQSANPGYIKGDELICVARVAESNVNSIVKRFTSGC